MSDKSDLRADEYLALLEAKAPGEFKIGHVGGRTSRVNVQSFSYVSSQLGEDRAVLACEDFDSIVILTVYRGEQEPQKTVFAKKLKGDFYDRARKVIDRELTLNGEKVPPPKLARMSIRELGHELFGRS